MIPGRPGAEPMKAQPIKALPDDLTEHIIEGKYDGWRGFIVRDPVEPSATMFSSTGNVLGSTPYINACALSLPAGTILDGEIVNLDGSRQFNKAASICQSNTIHVPSATDAALTFMAFDVLEAMGKDVRGMPLTARKELLAMLLKVSGCDDPNGVIRAVEPLPDEDAIDALIDAGFEGVVLKQPNSIYMPGSRGPQWLKYKPNEELEGTIIAYFDATPGSKFDGKAVGGIVVDIVHADGHAIQQRVGTGMSEELREAMYEDAHVTPSNFIGKVVEVKHWGIGEEGALRHPSLKRIRDEADKAVAENPEVIEPPSANGTGTLDPTQIKATTPQAKVVLEMLVEAQRERDEWKATAENLQMRLDGAVRGAVEAAPKLKPTQRSSKRNYKSMTPEKLRASVKELQLGSGPAYETAIGRGEDPAVALRRAEEAAREKGVPV